MVLSELWFLRGWFFGVIGNRVWGEGFGFVFEVVFFCFVKLSVLEGYVGVCVVENSFFFSLSFFSRIRKE